MIDINDSSFLGYLLFIVLAIYIVSLLSLRWFHYGICTEKKYVLLLVVGYGLRAGAAATMRYMYLTGSTGHIPALSSWWWIVSQWVPVILSAIVAGHMTYYLADERQQRKRNGI